MLAIIDFDSTIFDTKNFRKALANAINVSIEDFNITSNKCFQNKGRNYDFDEHFETLLNNGYINMADKDRLLNSANLVIDDVDKFLFPDAVRLLDLFKQNQVIMVLMTRGNLRWQHKKIKKLKAKTYFERVVVIDNKKSQELGFLDDYKGEVIILNDRPHETIAMAEAVKQKHRYFIVKSIHSLVVPPDERTYELKEIIEELYGDQKKADQ